MSGARSARRCRALCGGSSERSGVAWHSTGRNDGRNAVRRLLAYLLRSTCYLRGSSERAPRIHVAEGSYASAKADGRSIPVDGERSTRAAGSTRRLSQTKGGGLVYADEPLRSSTGETQRSLRTPAGDARMQATRCEPAMRREGTLVETVARALHRRLGRAREHKWYGVMGFGVSFIVLVLVWLQTSSRQPRPARVGQSARLPARRGARDDPAS